jgi:hypothetical protein
MKIKLLSVNSKYNQLTAIGNTQKVSGSSACVYMCDCGNIIKSTQNYKLTSGITKSCGYCKKETDRLLGTSNSGNKNVKGKKFCTSLIGKFFDNLLVTTCVGLTSCGHEQYECTCSYGNTTIVNRSNLLNGTTHSCGCLRIKHSVYRLKKGLDPDVLMFSINAINKNKNNISKIQKQIKQRDNFTDYLCGHIGGVLHIAPVSESFELQCELTNLSKKCHKNKAHDGRFNKLNKNIQTQLISYMKDTY